MRTSIGTLARFAVVSAACLALFSSPSRAQNVLLGAHDLGTDAPACNLNVPAGGVVFLAIRVEVQVGPVQAAHFGILPSQGTWSGTYADVIVSGACLNLGDVLTIIPLVNIGGDLFGVNFDVVPATGHTAIELTDCDGYAMVGGDRLGTYLDPCEVNYMVAGYRPAPADGANDVPINISPSWVGPGNLMWLADHPITSYLDADLVCWPDFWRSDENGYVPGVECNLPLSLAPFTTYYWVIGNGNPFACLDCETLALSKMYSFTTGDAPILTESSTWGHVKSLYR